MRERGGDECPRGSAARAKGTCHGLGASRCEDVSKLVERRRAVVHESHTPRVPHVTCVGKCISYPVIQAKDSLGCDSTVS